MSKGIILNFKKIKIFNYVNLNKVFLILCALFIVGVSIGSTVLLKNSNISTAVENFFKDYILLHGKNTFLKKLLLCFLRYFSVIVLYFLSGSCAFGVAVVPFLVGWQGIFFGRLVSYIYKAHGISGIAFNAIIFIPSATFFTLCCFFAARYAIDFSLLISKLTLPRSRPMSLYINFKNYCAKFLLLTAFSLLCAIFEIILNLLFLNFFNY